MPRYRVVTVDTLTGRTVRHHRVTGDTVTAAAIRCQDCNYTAPYEEFRPARDITLRHDIGDTYSDRECPLCGALACPAED